MNFFYCSWFEFQVIKLCPKHYNKLKMNLIKKKLQTLPKDYRAKIMLRLYAGVAKPSPKMGQSLGPLGINMMQFCKEFNAAS